MLNVLYYALLFTLSLGQFSSLSRSADSNLYLFDGLSLVFGIFGVAYFLLKKKFVLPKYSIIFLFFVISALLSLLVNFQNFSLREILISWFYWVRLAAYILDAIIVFNMINSEVLSREKVYSSLILSGLFISIAGFIQLVVLPDFTTLDPTLGWDPHKNRLASTFFDQNFTGAYLVMCLTLVLHRFFYKKLKAWEVIVALIITVALFLTFSRSAWLMFAVVIFVYSLFKNKYLLFAAIILAFLAYFAVPRVQTRISGITDPADSASLRLTSWKDTWSIARDSLAFGTGYNTFRYVQVKYGFLDPDTFNVHSGAGSDSSLLFVLATTGLLGLAFYLLALLYPLLNSLLSRKQDWLLCVSFIGGLLLESLFINSLFYPQILFVFMVILFSCSVSDI